MNNDNIINPQPTPSQPINPQPTPPQPIGIFTPGVTPTDPAQFEKPKSNNSSKKLLTIILIVIIVIVIGVAGYFLIPKLLSTKKSIAEFKQIVSSLGYSEISGGSQETDEGKVAFYMKGTSTKVEGIAMFLEASSKDTLKRMMEQSMSDMGVTASTVDLSKSYNKALDCYSSKKESACVGVVLKENTILMNVYFSKTSEEEARTEIEKVIEAMGYQE